MVPDIHLHADLVHAAEGSECFLYSFANYTNEVTEHVAAGAPGKNCGCEKSRPKHSKGKFVYLKRGDA